MLKEYFGGVLALCALISVALGVAHPRLKRTVSFGAGILIISAIMLPLVDIIRDFDAGDAISDIFEGIEFEDKTDSSIEIAFEEGIAEYVAATHGLEVGCVDVRVDGFDMESLRAERIYVTLSGKAALIDYKRLEAELRESFTSGGECEVSLNIG